MFWLNRCPKLITFTLPGVSNVSFVLAAVRWLSERPVTNGVCPAQFAISASPTSNMRRAWLHPAKHRFGLLRKDQKSMVKNVSIIYLCKSARGYASDGSSFCSEGIKRIMVGNCHIISMFLYHGMSPKSKPVSARQLFAQIKNIAYLPLEPAWNTTKVGTPSPFFRQTSF